jgi:hypothetical protein
VALVQGEHAVGAALPGMPVGDQDHGPAGHQGLDDRHDLPRDDRVEMGGGLVKQQQRRVPQERASQGDPLPLPG